MSSIGSVPPQTGSVDSDIIKDLSVDTVDIKDNAITNPKIADGAVDTIKLVDDSVVTTKIADGAVTSPKILDGSIDTSKIADEAITLLKMGVASVDGVALKNGSVSNLKMASLSVDTVNIVDNSVTNAKLGDGSVSRDKLNFGSKGRALIVSATAVFNNSILIGFGHDFSTYKKYTLEIVDVLSDSDGDGLAMRVSDDNGATFKSGAGDYGYLFNYTRMTDTLASGNASTNNMPLHLAGASSTTHFSINSVINIYNAGVATKRTFFDVKTNIQSSSIGLELNNGCCIVNSNSKLDGFEIKFNTGTITTGLFRLYGE